MICAVFPLGLLAQQRTEYNRKGDEAMIIVTLKCDTRKAYRNATHTVLIS